jgi:hypothetical protein
MRIGRDEPRKLTICNPAKSFLRLPELAVAYRDSDLLTWHGMNGAAISRAKA